MIELSEDTLRQISGGESTTEIDNNNSGSDSWNVRDFIIDAVLHWDES